MKGAIRSTLHLSLAFVVISSSLSAETDSKTDLIKRCQGNSSELVKRDLALKMIDDGVLKCFVTTTKDIARIFGADWTADMDVKEYESYGIVYFAKQPTPPPTQATVQVPFVGWYLVIRYNTKNQVVVSWELSNVHK